MTARRTRGHHDGNPAPDPKGGIGAHHQRRNDDGIAVESRAAKLALRPHPNQRQSHHKSSTFSGARTESTHRATVRLHERLGDRQADS